MKNGKRPLPKPQGDVAFVHSDVDNEQAVLGSALISRQAAEQVIAELKPEDYAYRPHAPVHEVIEKFLREEQTPDPVTVHSELLTRGKADAVGGLPYLFTLSESVPTAAHVGYYIEGVQNDADLRYGLELTDQYRSQFLERARPAKEIIGDAEQSFAELGARRNRLKVASARQMMGRAFNEMGDRLDEGGINQAIPTGFSSLDAITGGLFPETLTIISGRTSMGKSYLATGILRNTAMAGYPSLLYSLEMSEHQVSLRLLAMETGIPVASLSDAEFANSMEWRQAAVKADVIAEWPLYVCDECELTAANLRAHLREVQRVYGIRVVVIDHLNEMPLPRVRDGNTHQAITEVVDRIRKTARALKLPIILLSQLSRELEKRPNKRPVLRDLRESGSIEEKADVVLMLYRDSYYLDGGEEKVREQGGSVTEVLVRKNRPTAKLGTAKLWFDVAAGTFHEVDFYRQAQIQLEVPETKYEV